MNSVEDIEYTEFFEVGDKVTLTEEFGVIVKTYKLDKDNIVIGGSLIVRWDTRVEADFEDCSGNLQCLLSKVDKEYEFKHINDDGTEKI